MTKTHIEPLTIQELLQSEADTGAILAPGRPALSYRQLRRQILRTAGMLRSAGVNRNDRVAVVLPNGPEMATCFLGVASAATCAPLNPNYRAQEFAFYLDDLRPKLVIVRRDTESPVREVAASHGIEIVELGFEDNDPAGSFDLGDKVGVASENHTIFAELDDVALVLHTSGTTSRPKIVPLKHKNLCASARNIGATLALTPDDRCLNVMPLFHIHGLMAALLSSLTAGGCTVCSPGFIAPQFFKWIDEFAPTWYTAVPTIHQAVLARAEQNRDILARHHLRFIRSSSSPLSPTVMDTLQKVFSAPVIEAYGMTEASHQMASNPLPPRSRKPGSVGLPTGIEIGIMGDSGDLAVLDADGTAVGEVVVRGPSVTEGYADNPDANRDAFRDGWFRTGDQGRLDADGYLFLAGRTKEIINRGGEKISPREVDEALLDHPAVEQAVTFALPDPILGEDVAAAVILRAGGMATEMELREFAAQRLADFKVPRRIVFLEEIPKGPTGKPQRIGLADKLGIKSETRKLNRVAFVAPRTATETLLCKIWAEVLGIERVGIDDDFFASGGDSVLAARMLVLIGNAKNKRISLTALFENPQVSRLAQFIESAQDLATLPPLVSTNRSGRLPLSFAQERMWFLAKYEPDSSAYVNMLAWRLPEPLDKAAVQRSFGAVVERHEVLRTVYHLDGKELTQEILAHPPLPWSEVDVSDSNELELDDIVAKEWQNPFDLSRDLPIRAVLVIAANKTHYLLVLVHHIASDGWSKPILRDELTAFYKSFTSNTPTTLPKLEIQYGDFAVWERRSLGLLAQRQLEYWRSKLSGSPPVLPLPLDHARPAQQTFRGESLSLHVPAEQLRPFQDLCGRERVTLFMGLLAVFQILLSRYSGADDIVVGSTIANRQASGTEPLIGLLMNTLALRTDLSGDPSVRDLLARVRETVLGAFENPDLPFATVVDALQPERSTSYTPVYQVLFQLRNFPDRPATTGAFGFTDVSLRDRIALLDLELDATENRGGVDLKLIYNADLFDRDTAAKMLEHFQILLFNASCDPKQSISRLGMLGDSEHQQLLTDWNNTTKTYPEEHNCLHEIIENQVQWNPDQLALIFESQQLTYRELNGRANRLAHRLRKLGVGPDTIVGVFLERSVEMVVALLGILKAGGAYLPLDPENPKDRLAFMLEDADAPVLLTASKFADKLPAHRAKIICLDTEWSLLDGEPDTNPSQITQPENLAYVIYTSGSTGKPKGVCNTHRGIVNRLLWMQGAYNLDETDRVMQKTPYSFDVSVWEFFWPLMTGACLVVARPGGHKDPPYLVDTIAKQKITTLHFVPSMMRVFLESPDVMQCRNLRRVFCSGEALPLDLQEHFFRHLSAELHNLYGPTEASVDVTYWHCRRDSGLPTVPIGKPIWNTQVYILDKHLQPVPVGVAGELHIGGIALARGYLKRPELTAEKFIPDPFSQKPGARLYKTGDLARFLPDGNIEYLGRLDHQVKIRGFRIELGEIESMLDSHPAVGQSVVVAREDTPGDKRLVAYLVAAPGSASMTDAELRTYLKKNLPEYMVPSAFVFLDRLPLTASGKVDRKALPVPSGMRPTLTPEFVLPRTPQEERLAAIWCEVLGVQQVGVHDNFFELGGDSILSIQTIALARREGLKITTQLFFSYQTIAELAVVAEAHEPVRGTNEIVDGEVPLTPVQKWFFEQNLEQAHHFNQTFLLEVEERLDRSLFEQALAALSAHHDALRLRYVQQAQGWHQFYASKEEAVPLTWFGVDDSADLDQPERLAERCTSLQGSLNLQSGPLWRVAYFDRGVNRAGRLLFIVHHLAVDGVSWRPLLEDLETSYRQLQGGEPVHLPVKTTSYKAWAERLQEFAKEESLQQELLYWRQVCESSESPVAEAVAVGPEQARTLQVSLSAEQTQALLQQVPAVYNTQINDVLLTALGRAWQQTQGTNRLRLNLEGHGRENLGEVDLTRTVGWFTSIFPVRLDFPPNWQAGEALKSIKEQLRQIPRHGIGYGVLRYLTDDSELGNGKEPSLLFNYLGQWSQTLAGFEMFRLAEESTGLSLSRNSQQRHHYALEVTCLVIRGRLECRWTYCPARYSEAEIHRLSGQFLASLGELIRHCQSAEAGGRTPSDFPLARLDQATLDRLVGSRRDIEDVYPLSPIQALFSTANLSSLSDPFDQWHCTLHGPLNVPAFQRAWLETLQRHTILRSSLKQDGLREPLQIVHREVRPSWRIEDWSDLPSDQRAERWSAFLKQDRSQPLALSEAPAMRFALVRLDAQTWKFLWSVSALLLDGWSWPMVFRDVSRLYQAASQQTTLRLEPVRPYRDYLEWLDRQPSEQAHQFWKETLADLREPTALVGQAPSSPADDHGRYVEHCVEIDAVKTEALQQMARNLQVTLNSLMQGAWALLLGHQAETNDVVFGSAFAGRPTDLPGANSIVGPFVNNLPVRLAIDGQVPARDFFRQVHKRLLEMSLFQFTPLLEIQRCSEIPWRYRLFNSLVVFQNYLVDESARRFGEGIEIAEFSGAVHTNYPVMLLVRPGSTLPLRFIYDCQSVAGTTVEDWGRALKLLLERIPALLQEPVAALQVLLPRLATGTQVRVGVPIRSPNFAPPQTETERIIAAVWEQILGLEHLSVDESFFNLGGHSLVAIQIMARINDAFQIQLPLHKLFESPTVAALADQVERARKDTICMVPPIERLPRESASPPIESVPPALRKNVFAFPVSFAQERMWFLNQLMPESAFYNVLDVVRFAEPLQMGLLKEALNELLRRHEVLRTAIVMTDGEPIQIVEPFIDFALVELDLSVLPESDREREWIRVAQQQWRKPFDLSSAPLMRGTILHMAPEEHILVLAFHHIIVDEWSLDILRKELRRIYVAFREGKPSPFPDLPIQYGDFSYWERRRLQGEALEPEIAYWKQALAGAPTILDLPTDKARPAAQTFRGNSYSFRLPKRTLQQVKSLARQEGCTTFIILAAAFLALLNRYTAQDDILLGTPTSGRTRSVTQQLVGLFLNTVVLRARFDDSTDFRSLVHQVREGVWGAYGHQELPFEQVVRELETRRDPSRTPLFQVMFIMNSPEASPQELKSLGGGSLHSGTSKFDLTLFLSERNEELHGTVEYSTDLFGMATIERLVSYYHQLMEQFACDPDQKIFAAQLLTNAERQRLLVEWNDTAQDLPEGGQSLHQIIEERVQRDPLRTAVIFESEHLSYQELNRRANQLAHYLRKLGVGPDSIVGVFLERSVEMVVALLGILKAGAAYLPLDPDYPKQRLAFMLEDADAIAVLTTSKLDRDLPAHSSQVFCFDTDSAFLENQPNTNLLRNTGPENLAYVIYTSGSTGQPKGVCNTHRGIVNRLLWMQGAYNLDETDRVMQKTPYSFDVSVWEFFWPLMTGACLVVARPGGHKDPPYLVDTIAKQKITTLHFVPSMMRVFLESPDVMQCRNLRRVFCSGEALPLDLQEHFFRHLSAELHNLYGPTEASVDVTYWHCRRDSGLPTVPIGKPIWNTQVYILDKHLQPVPVGVAGELHIGGIALARGYLKRPELTAEKFIPDPFSQKPGARLYKTGDLARFLPDGNIEYLGRLDHQVKIRGFRIELGEIESMLDSHPAVGQSVVVAREDTPGDKRLVAYLVAAPGSASMTDAELRTYLKKNLPEYMVPSAFVFLDRLPLTASGKVDRKTLPAQEATRPEYLDEYKAPRNSVEEHIAQIWAVVLGLDRVGVTDDFFALGGHSILATQIIARVNDAFRAEVPLRSLFEGPTVAALAGEVQRAQAEHTRVKGAIERATRQSVSLPVESE